MTIPGSSPALVARILQNLANAMFRPTARNISPDDVRVLRLRALCYALCLAITASLAMAASESSPKRETPAPTTAAPAAAAKASANMKALNSFAAAPNGSSGSALIRSSTFLPELCKRRFSSVT